jgi:GTP-binding protein
VEEGLQFRILLTKADKLTRSEQTKALQIARLQAGGGSVQLFSALKRQGVGEAALWLREQVDAAQLATDNDTEAEDEAADPALDDDLTDMPNDE